MLRYAFIDLLVVIFLYVGVMMSLLMPFEGCISSKYCVARRAGVGKGVRKMFTFNMVFDDFKTGLLVGAYLTNVGTSSDSMDELFKVFWF